MFTLKLSVSRVGLVAALVLVLFFNKRTSAQCFESSDLIVPSGTVTLCQGEAVTLAVEDVYTTVHWSNGASSANITVSSSGIYSVTVTDPYGCSASLAVNVMVNKNPNLNIRGNRVICNNAPATLDAGAGFANYLWSDGSTTRLASFNDPGWYSVTVTDSAGCSAANSISVFEGPVLLPILDNPANICAPDFSGVKVGEGFETYEWNTGDTTHEIDFFPGSYSVTVTNAGCVGFAETDAMHPPMLAPAMSGDTFICEGGFAEIELLMPTFYPVLWSTGATTQSIKVDEPGVYTVEVMENGCWYQGYFQVFPLGEAINASIVGPTFVCGNGSNQLSLNNPFESYTWSDGSTTNSLDVTQPGVYNVTVTSGICKAARERVVWQDAPEVSVSIFPSINDQPTGELNALVSAGGTLPFNYLWNTGATTQSLSGLMAGNYWLTVTSANGCTTMLNAEVISLSFPPPMLTFNVTNATCGLANGAIDLSASDGTPPYTFVWSNGATTEDLVNILAGTYTVTVAGSDGMEAELLIEVSDAPAPEVALSPTNASCGLPNGSIIASLSGGTGPFTYAWSNGATTLGIISLPAGTYTIIVTDSNGCTASESATLLDSPAPTLELSLTHATCGNNNGTVTTVIANGTPPFNVIWSNGATTFNLAGLAPGDYTISLSDAAGCGLVETVTINDFPAPGLSLTPTSTTCGQANGAVFSNITGGTGPFTFLWTNGGTAAEVNNAIAGSYTLTVSDANGCTASAGTTVLDLPGPAASAVATHTTCGINNGSIDVTVSSGTLPFVYTWSNAATTQDLSGLSAGSYSVTVTDDNGCTATATASVNPSQGIAVTPVPAHTSCGLPNGSITTIISTGAAPYSLAWSNGVTVQNPTSLNAGTYTVTVTDNAGCTAGATVEILPSTAPQVTANVANTTCSQANGTVNITVSNGTSPFTFIWSNGATTEDLSNVTAGSYAVTVTDASGCTATVNATVADTPPPSLTSAVTHETCGNANGLVNVTASGGVPPLSFAWSNGATTEDLSNAVGGTYTLTVTDNIGCTATLSATVNSTPAVTISSIADDAACGLNNGSVDATVAGGTSPFTYLWSNGATAQDLANVAAGTYTVTVTDANGCTATSTANVSNTGAPTLTLSSTEAACGLSNGTVTATVSGGTTPYSFAWSNGATTQNISNVAAGTYSLTVLDASGCQAVATAVVGGSALPVIVVNNLALCAGQTGTLTASGAATYTWSPSTGLSATTGASVTANPAVNTTYTVIGTDANGCSSSATAVVSVNMLPVASITPSSATLCPGQTASLTAAGGTSYTWVPLNGLSATTGAAVTAEPSVTTTYTVTVMDANGCSAQASVVITVALAPTVSVSTTPATCNAANGNAALTVNGGATPYTFAWSNGTTGQDIANVPSGTYTVTVTTAQGCTVLATANVGAENAPTVSAIASGASCGLSNGSVALVVAGGETPYTFLWSTGATTSTVTSVAGGSYSVTVTDANNCTVMASAVVTSTPAVAVTLTALHTTCGLLNGGVTAAASGGSTPYSFAWSNGATTQNVTGLAAGTYAVTVTGALGCTASQSVAINQSNVLALETFVNDATCGVDNGSVNAVAGGTQPYTYNWNTGATTQAVINLAAGSYSVTVQDANGCSAVTTASVSNEGGPQLQSTVTNAACETPSGSADIDVLNGTPPYSFTWSDGGTTATLANAAAGTYTVTVMDANNCQSVLTVNIGASLPPVVSGIAVNASCGEANGIIDLNLGGGAAPYTYMWSLGGTTEDLSGLDAGTYGVTVTDALGCTAEATFTVQASALPGISFDVTDAACGQSTGLVNATVTGGLAPYMFLWNTGHFTEDIAGVTGGNYTLTVTDDDGCTISASVVVGDLAPPQLNALITHATCANADGQIELSVAGAGPFVVNWSNATFDEDLVNAAPGTYSVTVLDANFCVTEQTFNINPGDVPYASYTTSEVTCGLANGSVDVSPGGGLPPYAFQWSNGATTQVVSGLSVGLYTFTVTDALGCTFIQSALITSSAPSPQLTATTTGASCGNPNGAINITVSDGTAPFDFIWSNGGTTEDLTNLQGGNYILTVTDALGCQDAILVTVGNIPAPTLGAQVTGATCGNANGLVNLNVSGGTAPYTFLWSHGASVEDVANLSGGTYTVTVSDAGGCSSTLTVNVSQTQPPVVDPISGPLQITAFAINTYSISPVAGVTYNWAVSSGNVVSGQGTNIIQAQWSSAGNYNIIVTITDGGTGCSVSDSLAVSVITDIEDLSQPIGSLHVYPNPTSYAAIVSFECANAQQLDLEIFAVDGRRVVRQIHQAVQGSNLVMLDTAPLPAGMYFVSLRAMDVNSTIRLVVER